MDRRCFLRAIAALPGLAFLAPLGASPKQGSELVERGERASPPFDPLADLAEINIRHWTGEEATGPTVSLSCRDVSGVEFEVSEIGPGGDFETIQKWLDQA